MAKARSTSEKKIREATAQSILLAGLGALAATEQEGTKLFLRLVERGEVALRSTRLLRLPRLSGRLSAIEIHHGRIKVVPAEKPKARSGSGEKLAGLLEELAPSSPSAAETAHLRRNAQARRAFLAEFGTLTSREVADLAGSSATNRAALANRWKSEGRIFAVETGGQTLFPAFQFSDDDGQPRPVVSKVLAHLQPRLSGWQIALWFSGRNGWLGAKRPVDVLTSNPIGAVEAARQESESFD